MERPRKIALGVLGCAALVACGGQDASHRTGRSGASVAAAMSEEADAGYARALAPRRFEFPADHLPHPRFRTEWWYLTGNLETDAGRRFGYQLTFFRNALAPPAEPALDRPSAWATRQAWLAHFALTDVETGRFVSAERLARGALGLAGAVGAVPAASRPGSRGVAADDGSDGVRLRVAEWEIGTAPGGPAPGPAAAGWLPLRVAAREEAEGGEVAVDLLLEPGKPPVAQGEGGLSHKGGPPGNASYYYSFTRVPTRGSVTLGERSFAVAGLSWIDREWSTSALAPGREGWDWFSIQLDDGRELMFYTVRRSTESGGGVDPASSGLLVAADGSSRRLGLDDVEIGVLGRWRSPRSGALYPSGWRLVVPEAGPRGGLELELTPVLEDQELDVGFRYWEGAVEVEGTSSGRPVRGHGYVELTGYDVRAGAVAESR